MTAAAAMITTTAATTAAAPPQTAGVAGGLRVQVATLRYGAREVLRNIDLRVAPGEIVSLIGASGCGKSTLLRIAAGLERRGAATFEGSVTLDGQRIDGVDGRVGLIFQEPRLLPWLSVAANVAFADGDTLSPKAAAQNARVLDLLAEVGLRGLTTALPKQLSGGQAQRVALARGLYRRPRVLLLDEPFGAVDAFTRIRLQDLLLRLAAEHGLTVLLVTHDVDEALYLSDRVVVMGGLPGEPVEDSAGDPLGGAAGIAADIATAAPPPRDRIRDRTQGHADSHAARANVLAALRGVHVF